MIIFVFFDALYLDTFHSKYLSFDLISLIIIKLMNLLQKLIFKGVSKFGGIELGGNVMKLVFIAKESLHKIRKVKNYNILKIPNKTVPFPIPDKFSRPGVSEQPFPLVLQQLEVLKIKTDHSIGNQLDKRQNKSTGLMELLDSRDTMKLAEIRSMDIIVDQLTKENNFVGQEVLFGELMFNGEDPYVAKKYTKYDGYDFKESAAIEREYQQAIIDAFSNLSQHDTAALASVGITSEQLQAFVNPKNSASDNTYSFLFEHLQRITKGKTHSGSANIFYDKDTIKQEFVLQSPYAVFTYQEKEKRFICLAIAIKFGEGKIGVYSPFRNAKNHTAQTWKMAKEITALATFNDFSVRVHLGVLHFTTSQYNVPIYNYLKELSLRGDLKDKHHRFQSFLNYTFEIFNRGLEGVNVGATAILVHPIAQFSLINNAFCFSSDDAGALLADNSNIIDLNRWNPPGLAQKKGLEKLMSTEGTEFYFDNQYFQALGGYVKEMWKIWKMDQIEQELLERVNNARNAMYVGDRKKGQPSQQQLRPAIQKGKLCDLFQNLMFSWVIYHSHTFSNVILAPYYEFKPSMLAKELPYEPPAGFKAKDTLPSSKVLMESVKLTLGTTVRDPGNYILDTIQRRAQKAKIKGSYGDQSQVQTAAALEKARCRLEEVTLIVRKVNAERLKENKFAMTWLDTSVMESSLNI